MKDTVCRLSLRRILPLLLMLAAMLLSCALAEGSGTLEGGLNWILSDEKVLTISEPVQCRIIQMT